MPITSISIHGFIVGQIWQPGCGECFKPLCYNIARQDKLWSEPGTLRDHVLCAVNDGDFQHATLAQADLVIERHQGNRRVIRSWSLSRFPSVADCLHPDGDDWCPPCDLED